MILSPTYLLIASNLFCLFILIFYFSSSERRLKQLQEKVDAHKRGIDPEVIANILADFRSRGMTIVRIDSNDIFYRSPRG